MGGIDANHRTIVLAILAKKPPAFEGDEWIILDEPTIERDWGWVYYWTSRLWHETKDAKYNIAGNLPIIVRRSDGKILPSTHWSIEKQISEYLERGELP